MDNRTVDGGRPLFRRHLIGEDAALEAALAASESAGLPPISVAANLGKLLMMVASMVGARRILEIGTLGGYSTIWMARALPQDGRLITLEIEPRNAAWRAPTSPRRGCGGRRHPSRPGARYAADARRATDRST